MKIRKEVSKDTKVHDYKPAVVKFGTRAVSDQNFSKMVALPKQALANLGNNIQRVNVELVQDKQTKYIRLTAATNEKTNEEGQEENRT